MLLSPSAYGLQKMLFMRSSFAKQNRLHFIVMKTQCIMFHYKHCVDINIVFSLNGDILTWIDDITHLGHHLNCCLSFRKDINIRKGWLIQYENEICTELHLLTLNVKLNY